MKLYSEQSIKDVGIGLRSPHIKELINSTPKTNWLEVLADNYFADGGIIHQQLEKIRQIYPIALHSVSMSIGSTDPLDIDYLQKIKSLAKRYQPDWISDHLCFSQAGGRQSHDLLPLPFTEEAVKHTVQRITQIQDFLEQQIVIENISSYLRYNHSTMNEAEFIRTITEQADCFILLDLNNCYVNQCNHNEDAFAFIDNLPTHRIKQLHLGGYQFKEKFLLDAHNNRISDPVWDLFKYFVHQNPTVATLIEWDNDIPSLEILLDEAHKAQMIINESESQIKR